VPAALLGVTHSVATRSVFGELLYATCNVRDSTSAAAPAKLLSKKENCSKSSSIEALSFSAPSQNSSAWSLMMRTRNHDN
jgi:hypothetical protein